MYRKTDFEKWLEEVKGIVLKDFWLLEDCDSCIVLYDEYIKTIERKRQQR